MPKPVGYRISVEMDRVDEKIGSFYIPTEYKNKLDEAMDKGTVLEVGPEAYLGLSNGQCKVPWVKPGDRIYFKSYGGQIFRYKSGRHVRIINDESVIAIVSAEDELDELL